MHVFISGFFALIVSLMAFTGAVYMKYPIQIVHTKFIQLITSGIIFSFVLSLLLYIKARRGPNASLAPGGNTGNEIFIIKLKKKKNFQGHYVLS